MSSTNILEFPMTKKTKFTKRRVAYRGQRFDGKKLSHSFEIVHIEGGHKPEDTGRECSYPVKRGSPTFIIGQLYDVPMNLSYTAKLHDAEQTDFFVDAEQIEQWSARDAASRHAKHVAGTRNRLIKDRREAWLEGMLSLRIEYCQMSFAERRAMRQLVLEWLEERP
jgi:hypothetical protein